MKANLTKKIGATFIGMLLIFSFSLFCEAQNTEKLIIYENFGGADAGTSELGIQPVKWPAVHSDSGEYAGWNTTLQKLDGKNETVPVPQFYANKTFHIDSVSKYRDGGLPGGITVDFAKRWTKTTPFLNGYVTPGESATSLGFKFWGATVMPELLSWISYAPYTPDYLKNQTDEQGYIYFGKDIPDADRPVLTLPSSDFDYLKDISKLEILFSGSRLGKNNTISIRIEEVNASGITIGSSTQTYSATISPRFITVPVNKDYCRIYIQGWGDANNSSACDYALNSTNSEADLSYSYNYNAIAGTKPDLTTTNGLTGNPGILIHMIKMYAMMSGSGYTITTANVTGNTTNIAYGTSVSLTADATKDGKKFMGWNIEGKEDLSEVVNPLNIKITKDITIMPVYAGDVVELPVVNENFTDWTQRGVTLPNSNNILDYSQGSPLGTVWTGTVKVPFRYGFTSRGKDSVEIALKACNVIPQFGPRVYNLPGAEDKAGYVAFMGPNTDKGYVTVEAIDSVTKAVISVSSYDLPNPDRACAFEVNDSLQRNKMLQTLYAEDVTLTNNPVDSFQLQIGPGNQARIEYLTPEAPNADIYTGMSAAAVAMHNLQIYAKVTVPDLNYYKLTLFAGDNGEIVGTTPLAGNSSNHYLAGTKVNISALPDIGYGFKGWFDITNNLLSKEIPYQITMDAAKTIIAKFEQTPSYINFIPNNKGTVTTDIEPVAVVGNVKEFVAGVPLTITADPVFGFEFAKFIVDGSNVTDNPLTISNIEMVSMDTIDLEVVYDSIIAKTKVGVLIDTSYGSLTFDPEPYEATTIVGDTLFAEYPQGSTITVKASPKYSYSFSAWQAGLDVATENLSDNPISVTLDVDRVIAPVWGDLPRYLLIVNQGAHGTITITDEHKDGEQELLGLWPKDYSVKITAQGELSYYLTTIGPGVNANFITDTEVEVKMTTDTVTLLPEFAERAPGVILAVKENFQDPAKWPENEGTVSNVPGAIEFLELPANWDPTTYNNDLEGLLEILTEYRVWGSASNDNSDGPNGTKNPYTTLNLVYQTKPYSTKLQIGTTNDSVEVTLSNFAPCNNCLIGKAVKVGWTDNRYLGHVTPGMIALRTPAVEDRNSAELPAFVEGDSVGTMVISGLVYVEKVEVGFVTASSQFCPGVFYTIEDGLEIVNEDGYFQDVYGDLWSIGQVERPDYRPYDNKYGWGSAQEGMIMDKNMYIAEEGVPETKVILTAGYREGAGTYTYSNIYIHDLKIWGSASPSTGMRDLIAKRNLDQSKFYMLGSTNYLKIDINEPIKALVIYDMRGVAIKVIRDLNTNIIDIGELNYGIYGAQAYGRSGEMYQGIFGKVSY